MGRIQHLAFGGILALGLVANAAHAEDMVLNVYNWSDYIAEDTLKKFEAETGIKVNYDVYDSNEILEAKLMAGNSGYDVVFPSATPYLARQIKAGIYQELDRSKLPNWPNVLPSRLKSIEVSDPGNKFAVPYMTAGTGIGINVKKVKELAPDAPTDSWAILLDPKWTAKLKSCGLTMLDDPTEAFPAAYSYLGKDPQGEDKSDLDAATEVLAKIRPDLKYIHSSSYINDLANGEVCVSHGYGGDLIQARDRAKEANQGVEVLVFLPKEGAQVVTDVMAVPKDAKHPEAAHKFINFMMRPDIVGPITDFVGYANAIKGADQFVSEERRNDPVIYPPQEVQDKFFSVAIKSPAYEKSRTRAWTRIKTGQ